MSCNFIATKLTAHIFCTTSGHARRFRLLGLCALMAVVGLSLWMGSVAQATTVTGPITGVTILDFSTQFGGRPASETTNGFGFNGTDFTFPGPTATGLSAGTFVDPDTGYTVPIHNTSVGDMWLTNNAEPGSITYDLGSELRVDRVWIYNYNESGGTIPYTNRGASTTGDVFTSLDGVNFTPHAGASNQLLKQATGTTTYGQNGVGALGDIDSINFGFTKARYVRFTNLNSFPLGDNNYMGLSEVIFFEGTPPPIPEPSTCCLLGLGALGLLRHSRRRRNLAGR